MFIFGFSNSLNCTKILLKRVPGYGMKKIFPSFCSKTNCNLVVVHEEQSQTSKSALTIQHDKSDTLINICMYTNFHTYIQINCEIYNLSTKREINYQIDKYQTDFYQT